MIRISYKLNHNHKCVENHFEEVCKEDMKVGLGVVWDSEWEIMKFVVCLKLSTKRDIFADKLFIHYKSLVIYH